MNTEQQDSTQETLAHINRVRDLSFQAAFKVLERGLIHDKSKLDEPEKSGFDRLKSLQLSGMDYASPEYKDCLKTEEGTIKHHYSVNSHHPEHFPNGVSGMTLFDVVEMLMDWKAATERMKAGGNIRFSLDKNTERFNLSPQLVSILKNTIEEMKW